MESSFFRDMAETSVDGLWVIDLDGGTRYANPALAGMFGVSRAEFQRLTVYDTLDEAGREQFALHLEDLRAGRPSQGAVDVYFVRHDGTGMWMLVSEQILRDEDGAVVGALHRLTDNDERRRRMDELDESRRQLAEAHAIARLGGFSLDAAAGLISASESMCEIFGLDPSEPLTVADWMDAVHEDDRGHLQGVLEGVLTDGGEFDVLVRVAGPDGWIWTRGRGVARRDAAGRICGLAGTHQDVTAHKRIEAELEHHIARNWLVQAIATACNEASTLGEALGELRCAIRQRRDWTEARAFVPTDDGEGIEQLLADTYDDGRTVDRDIAASAMRTGERSWDDSGTVLAFPLHFRGRVHAVVTLTAAAVPERPGETTAAVGEAATLLTRVLEREEAEQQLAAARDEAIRASQAKSEFLAVMSHEIRTPLNGVIGLNDLMLKTSLERRQRQLARGIRDAGRSLLRLVNDVLDLSKIEAGHLELETVDFEVREVCDRAVELMGDSARRKGIELAVACDPDVPEMLAGDPTRLAQVLTNLISNAVKFTEAGQVLVTVRKQGTGRRVRLRVDVTDTGVGIAADALERVFDDFSQADLSTTRVHGGTGLGLSISRRIVQALDGELTLESTLGEGSTFTFTAAFDVPRGSRTCPDDDVARARLSGGRVLVVSGSETRARLLGDQMSLWRSRLEHVADEQAAALAVARAHEEEDPFEAVVVDVPAGRPPEVGQAADLLDLANGSCTFLLLTQRPEAAVVWAMRAPSMQVLTKPITSADLRGALLGVDEEESPVSATTAKLVRTDRPRVLVVEDNQVNQMVATGMLETLGYDIELAVDGIEAVEKFDPERHDAVLMDVQMPRMDGYAATRAMREQHADGPRTPILAMTAAAIDGERERCLKSGMDDYLTKPVELNQVGAALARWLPVGPPTTATLPAPAPGAETGAATPDPAIPPALLAVLDPRVVPKPQPVEAQQDPGSHPGEPEPVESAEAEPAEAEPAEAEPATDDSEDVSERAVLDSSRLDALREMGPHADTYIARAVDNFVARHEELFLDLQEALAISDPDAVRHAAHKLAGSALNLGLNEVGIAARAVELREDASCSAEAYDPLVADLEAAIRRALPVLEAYRDSRAGSLSPA